MRHLLIIGLAAILSAPAYADVSAQCTPSGCVTVKTPNFVFVPPRPHVFTFTRSVERRGNGDKVIVTTTFRDGAFWSKEKAVVRANREAGKSGGSSAGKGEGRRGR